MSETYDEPLLQPETRLTVFPIKYPELDEHLQNQKAAYWKELEVELKQDCTDWLKLTNAERNALKIVLAFFAVSDILVNENLENGLLNAIPCHEVQQLYNYQKMMEDIHSRMYGLLIETYITDPVEKKELLDSIVNHPIIALKSKWIKKWAHSKDTTVQERVFAASVTEGIFFSGSFTFAYWVKIVKKMMPGFTKSNDLISRDEGMHVMTHQKISKLFVNKCSQQRAHDIISEAVEIEIQFMNSVLSEDLVGLNSKDMAEYIKFITNRHLLMFGYDPLYSNINQPFKFMDMICLQSKSNFFENDPSEYQKSTEVVDEDDIYSDLTKYVANA